MTTIKEKRKYEKLSMRVYELKQQPQLLQSSGGGFRNPYDPTSW